MSCLYKIKEAYNSFTSTEKKIADYILNNKMEVLNTSSQKLAIITNTSASAWIRFAKRLGYKGLTAMKMDLPNDHYDMLNEENRDELFNILIKQNDSLDVMIKKVQHISLNTINQTYKLLNLYTLQDAIEKILKAKNIYLIGIGGSGIICNDIMHKFSRINKSVIYHEDSHILIARIAHIKKDDVLIAISYSGETQVVNMAARQAKSVDAKIIAITQYNVKSTLSKIADIKFYTPVEEKELRIGSISSRNAALVLTDLIYYGIAKENIKQTELKLVKTRELIYDLETKRG